MIAHIALGKTPAQRSKAAASLIRSGQISLGGYRKAKIYGLLSCSSGKKMKAAHRVFFRDEEEAIREGYRPCGHCLPEKYKLWKALITARNGLQPGMPGSNFVLKNRSVMETQQEIDYNRIAAAIEFFRQHFKKQPSLEEAAEHVHLSPFHFQRMFRDWAGVTPKQFLQYLSVEHAKELLKATQATLFDAAYETGLSGTGRLHDLFIKVEGMTPGEYRNGGENLDINYSFAVSPFGNIIVASTHKGICYMAFADEGREDAFARLRSLFPNARYTQLVDSIQQHALFIFGQDWSRLGEIKLHLKGTRFQIKVWETLLQVPAGGLTTYASLAEKAGHKGAYRAVGTAVGNNPVALLIPCHRVIRANGEIGDYHWGSIRKKAIIGWEAAKRTLK